MIIMTEKIKETLLSIKKHYNIDLAIFNDRVKLQKIVYLLKKMDLNALNKYNDSNFVFLNGDTVFSQAIHNRINEIFDSNDEGIYLLSD